MRHQRSYRLHRAAALLLVATLSGCGGDGNGRASTLARSEPAVVSVAAHSPGAGPGAVPAGAPAGATPPEIERRPGRIEDLQVEPVRQPVRLRIDAIDVLAPTVAVGVDGSGDLEVPTADTVGWYRFGPSPGQPGSAVLAAHVDQDGERGVFWDLDQLSPGDRLTVAFADGPPAELVVEARRRYAKAALPAAELFARSGPPRVTLITCGGGFDEASRSYDDNVVVTAVPAER